MAPVNLSHRRTHNLLLISKLLGLRDTASPLTLVQDSLEQPATPLIKEYIRRAKVSRLVSGHPLVTSSPVTGKWGWYMTSLTTAQLSKVHVTLIAFETLKQPDGVDAFVSAHRKSPADITKEVAAAYQPAASVGPSKRECLINSVTIYPCSSV